MIAIALLAATALAHADNTENIREALIENLSFMKSVYRAEYAPAAWKKHYANWELDTEIAKAESAARNSPDLTLKDAQRIAKSFIYSMKDYHVSISFQSTESAALPFTVRGVGNKYFLVYIDRAKLGEDTFPFQVGDEVVSFGDVSTAEAVAAVQKEGTNNIEATDRARAELSLTSRSAMRGYTVPQGPITIGIKPRGSSKISCVQLLWDYRPEKIKDPFSASQSLPLLADDRQLTAPSRILTLRMSIESDPAASQSDNPYILGARKTFTPDLGPKVWESDPDAPFYAYLYKTADRHLIGYVRIPSYVPDDFGKAEAAFSKLIAMFEAGTDALVIDQVNNPGGSVFYLYSLASMLSDQPLATPKHRMAVTQADVLDAYNQLEKLKDVKDDASAKKAIGDSLDGFPASYEVAQFLKNYLHFVIDEFNAGRTLTRPYWLQGADHINPAPVHYTKPILLVINNLDFSGGDFFPAIMQDNKRVTTIGTRTAGAGGYVNDVSFPNDLGINAFRVTESIAERVDKNPIENLGVKPDIEVSITENDLTSGYADYVKALDTAVRSLIAK